MRFAFCSMAIVAATHLFAAPLPKYMPAITDKLKIVNPWNDPSYVNYGTTFDMTFDDYVAKFGTITVESRIGINATK